MYEMREAKKSRASMFLARATGWYGLPVHRVRKPMQRSLCREDEGSFRYIKFKVTGGVGSGYIQAEISNRLSDIQIYKSGKKHGVGILSPSPVTLNIQNQRLQYLHII